MNEFEFYVGITKDNELYKVKYENERYHSFTGETYRIEDIDEDQVREYIGDFWKDMVVNDQTKLGKEDFIDWSINNYGIKHTFDTADDIDRFNDQEDKVVTWSSAGQHIEEVKDIKEWFIPKPVYENFIKLWKNYHLKDTHKTGITGIDQFINIHKTVIKLNVEKRETFITNWINGLYE